MFDDNYPTSEQIWFIRELLHKSRNKHESLSVDEKAALATIQSATNKISFQMACIQAAIEPIFSEEDAKKIREEGDPFLRPGAIFMGSGHFSEYGTNRIYEALDMAIGTLSWLQQGGLQGNEPDSAAAIADAEENIRSILVAIGEKLGQEGMEFPKK